MLPYKVFPSHIGWIQIHGLFEAIGFLVAIWLLLRYVRKRFSDKTANVESISLWVIVGSVIGARLAYVLGNFDAYRENLLQIFNLLGGGLSYFGGLTGGILAAYLYCKKKMLDFLDYADLFAVYIPLGHAIGRIGDYLIGEHIGTVTNVPWAVLYQGEIRHLIPLYDLVFNFASFLFLIRLRKKDMKRGMLFATYLLLYGLFRFLTGFIRIDEAKALYGVSIIQYFTLLLVIFSLIWMFRIWKKTSS